MKMTLLSRFVIILALFLSACATTANYEKQLAEWVGKDADLLVKAWGPPVQVYEMKSGKMLTFMTDGGATGFTQVTPYSGMAMTSLQSNYCKTVFEVDGKNIIQSWKWDGNMCKAYAPK